MFGKCWLLAVMILAFAHPGAGQYNQGDVELGFTLYNANCITCHGGSAPAAQFDLRPYTNTEAVVQDYPRWNLVLEKLVAYDRAVGEYVQARSAADFSSITAGTLFTMLQSPATASVNTHVRCRFQCRATSSSRVVMPAFSAPPTITNNPTKNTSNPQSTSL